ncbi:MAG: hypothetical protein ACFE8E_08005 [Candidatus Hodarchaeota archaeon]
MLLIPELVFLYLLTLRGPSPGQMYTRMKASKQQHLPYYDLAVTRMYGMAPGYPGVKMDEVWNPDSTKPIDDEEKVISIKKKQSMWKVTMISLICTISFSICSIESLIIYFQLK